MSARKEVAINFLQSAATGNVREAYRQYVGPNFRHHNAYFAAGAASLMEAMEENAKQHSEKKLEILRVLEDGDLVAAHSRLSGMPGGMTAAVVHIFRFEGDKVVELWDLGQMVPSDCPNSDGMF